MAINPGQDGLLGHLKKLTPLNLGQTLGQAMPHLDLPGMPGHDSGPLTETDAFGDNPGNLRMLSYVPEGLPADAARLYTDGRRV
jgi:hypothetical protein